MYSPRLSPSESSSLFIFNRSIPDVFETNVEQFGDRVAIQEEGTSLTYHQLNSAANRIARHLPDTDAGSPQPIGIFIRQKPHFLAALMGVFKSGNFVLPLDPDFPESHNRFVTGDAHARIILTDKEFISRASSLFPEKTVKDVTQLQASSIDTNLQRHLMPQASAALLYTSGSTGKPKGVVHSQRSLLHNAFRQTGLMHIGPDDRLSMLYATSVMGMFRDCMNALTCGAGLFPFDLRAKGISPFLEWVELHGITIFHTIPSFFRKLEDSRPSSSQVESVRMCILGGEAVLKHDVDLYREYFADHCLLFTGMGSTETGTIRHNILNKTCLVVNGTQPLGYPMQDVGILLQDESGNPVPEGGVGEIVVQSPFIADGYWERPELNRELFLPDPLGGDDRLFRTGDLGRFLPDGCLVHSGRKDYQVKVRGFRIELQEIESALLESGLVEEATVISYRVKPEDDRLVAYFKPRSTQSDLSESLRQMLARQLPMHMVPAIFIAMPALPRTPNGKVDRQSLPEPQFFPQAATPTDGTSMEAGLTRIWQDILSIKTPGLDDDFFSLGGDSLHAASLCLNVEKLYGLRLTPAVLIEHNTIRKLADMLRRQLPGAGKSLVAIRPKGGKNPLFLLPGGFGDVLYMRNLAPYLDPERPLYGLQALPAEINRSHGWKMEEIAMLYLTEVIALQPEGPYYLAGHSSGGYLALEMARQLQEQRRQVAFLGLWDTYPPGPRRQVKFVDRIMIHVDNLRGLSLPQVLRYFNKSLSNLMLRTVNFALVRSLLKWIGFTPKNTMMEARISRYNFHPKPYPGNVFLFKASQRPWYVHWDIMENWNLYITGNLQVREVKGDHGGLLFEPNVRDLGQKVNECMLNVDSTLVLKGSDNTL